MKRKYQHIALVTEAPMEFLDSEKWERVQTFGLAYKPFFQRALISYGYHTRSTFDAMQLKLQKEAVTQCSDILKDATEEYLSDAMLFVPKKSILQSMVFCPILTALKKMGNDGKEKIESILRESGVRKIIVVCSPIWAQYVLDAFAENAQKTLCHPQVDELIDREPGRFEGFWLGVRYKKKKLESLKIRKMDL